MRSHHIFIITYLVAVAILVSVLAFYFRKDIVDLFNNVIMKATPIPIRDVPINQPRNCKDIQSLAFGNLQNFTSGLYNIYVRDGKKSMKVEVFCDMHTDHGCWLVIQRRSESDRLDFYRSWKQYVEGFGNPKSSFWIGLDTISAITNTNDDKYELRIDLMDVDGEERYAKYEMFRVGNSTDLYRLHLGGYSEGDAGDSLMKHNGKPFSTRDRDNDDVIDKSCAIIYHGAWWYRSCHVSNLNGLYGSVKFGRGINWQSWKGYNYSMKRVEMKIRPINYEEYF